MLQWVRSAAQHVRHAPILRRMTPVWSIVRGPYLLFLRHLARQNGLRVQVGGHHMQLDSTFATIGWEKIECRSYQAFAEAVTSGSIVFDVGAHIGTYTIIACRLAGVNGRVFAFEPSPTTREFLRKHLIWNQVESRVQVIEACVGASSGTVAFYSRPGEVEAQSSVIPQDGMIRIDVPLISIDDFIDQIGLMPTLIKIDVEGGEVEVLLGAKRTLGLVRPSLLLSIHPQRLSDAGINEEKVYEILSEHSYEWTVIDRDHEIHVWAQPRPLDHGS